MVAIEMVWMTMMTTTLMTVMMIIMELVLLKELEDERVRMVTTMLV
jgi:hypothetical protein